MKLIQRLASLLLFFGLATAGAFPEPIHHNVLEEPYFSEDLVPALKTEAQPVKATSLPIDVLNYHVRLEPDIDQKTVNGSVEISFVSNVAALNSVEFDCGQLVIDRVMLAGKPQQFTTQNRRLKVLLPKVLRLKQWQRITVSFHGVPKYGIRFFPERRQVYTVFSTSQWMVCVDAPEDRAMLRLELIVPSGLTAVANGQFIYEQKLANKKHLTAWAQTTPTPTYVFGFAVGPFNEVKDKRERVELRYLSTGYSQAEVLRIFRDTHDMLRFYEDRAGVRYADRTYTQVLAAGGVEQEMSSFTALKETYGKQVLDNEQDLWLGAHEFAHQWWGNMVTCRNWNHFWLNEGIATFIATAYIEHRFGRTSYLREIESYRARYEKVRAEGKDKSLVFPDWLNPTREDRILVYDKGAYVMHLLREEMGERAFWNGLRIFTRSFFGKSVVTSDFTAAMQQASDKNLSSFFDKWIFLKVAGKS